MCGAQKLLWSENRFNLWAVIFEGKLLRRLNRPIKNVDRSWILRNIHPRYRVSAYKICLQVMMPKNWNAKRSMRLRRAFINFTVLSLPCVFVTRPVLTGIYHKMIRNICHVWHRYRVRWIRSVFSHEIIFKVLCIRSYLKQQLWNIFIWNGEWKLNCILLTTKIDELSS